MKNRPFWTVIGFVMFTIGIISLILSLVGLRFTFLSFLHNYSLGYTIFVLTLLFGGMVILYVARTEIEELD